MCICFQRLLEKSKDANCVDQFINDLHHLINLLSESEQTIEVAKVSFFFYLHPAVITSSYKLYNDYSNLGNFSVCP